MRTNTIAAHEIANLNGEKMVEEDMLEDADCKATDFVKNLTKFSTTVHFFVYSVVTHSLQQSLALLFLKTHDPDFPGIYLWQLKTSSFRTLIWDRRQDSTARETSIVVSCPLHAHWNGMSAHRSRVP